MINSTLITWHKQAFACRHKRHWTDQETFSSKAASFEQTYFVLNNGSLLFKNHYQSVTRISLQLTLLTLHSQGLAILRGINSWSLNSLQSSETQIGQIIVECVQCCQVKDEFIPNWMFETQLGIACAHIELKVWELLSGDLTKFEKSKVWHSWFSNAYWSEVQIKVLFLEILKILFHPAVTYLHHDRELTVFSIKDRYFQRKIEFNQRAIYCSPPTWIT